MNKNTNSSADKQFSIVIDNLHVRTATEIANHINSFSTEKKPFVNIKTYNISGGYTRATLTARYTAKQELVYYETAVVKKFLFSKKITKLCMDYPDGRSYYWEI